MKTELGHALMAIGMLIVSSAVSYIMGRMHGREWERLKQSQAARRAADEAHERETEAQRLSDAEIDARNEHWLNKRQGK